MVICQALTKQGSPCKAPAKSNSKFCPAHDPAPDARAAFRAGQVKGGKHAKIAPPSNIDIEIDPNKPESLKAAIAARMRAMVRTQPPVSRTVHALCDAARTILLIDDRTTIKAQLGEILRFIAAQRGQSPSQPQVAELLRLAREQEAEIDKRKRLRIGTKRESATSDAQSGSDGNAHQDGGAANVRGDQAGSEQ